MNTTGRLAIPTRPLEGFPSKGGMNIPNRVDQRIWCPSEIQVGCHEEELGCVKMKNG